MYKLDSVYDNLKKKQDERERSEVIVFFSIVSVNFMPIYNPLIYVVKQGVSKEH